MVASDVYLKAQLDAATPEQLHVMLLTAAIKHITILQKAIKDKDLTLRYEKIIKLGQIFSILEDQVTETSDFGDNLRAVYSWWYSIVYDVNSPEFPHLVDRVAAQIKEIRDAWSQRQMNVK